MSFFKGFLTRRVEGFLGPYLQISKASYNFVLYCCCMRGGKTLMSSRKKLIETCKKQLVKAKEKHLEALKGLTGELVRESSGDVADQASALQAETMSLARQKKLTAELNEIEQAIERIQNDTYGICEETGAPIEEKRLRAVPWTRLSLEGAEIREMEDSQLADSGE